MYLFATRPVRLAPFKKSCLGLASSTSDQVRVYYNQIAELSTPKCKLLEIDISKRVYYYLVVAQIRNYTIVEAKYYFDYVT